MGGLGLVFLSKQQVYYKRVLNIFAIVRSFMLETPGTCLSNLASLSTSAHTWDLATCRFLRSLLALYVH